MVTRELKARWCPSSVLFQMMSHSSVFQGQPRPSQPLIWSLLAKCVLGKQMWPELLLFWIPVILASSAETHTFVSLQADPTYYSVLIASPTWDKKLLLSQPFSLIRLCSFCFSPVEDSGVPPLKCSCGLKASLVQSSESKEQDKSFSRGTIASPMANYSRKRKTTEHSSKQSDLDV